MRIADTPLLAEETVRYFELVRKAGGPEGFDPQDVLVWLDRFACWPGPWPPPRGKHHGMTRTWPEESLWTSLESLTVEERAELHKLAARAACVHSPF